ncbi:FeoA family protein [Pseudoflavonifractor phocaeensis]|uniref:FeoA family protein n=1 Tax=Pseudoflavonifractor phocaeensis TaxID=1870988 RepID=UPI001FAF5E40|nr:FeoA domain-containing protein [Pseudoflavonifractor phocaeensis]
MMEAMMTLPELPVGIWGRVVQINAPPAMARRLMELGLIPGTRVCRTAESPAGDPSAYLIRGAVVALRRQDAGGILLYPEEGGEGR